MRKILVGFLIAAVLGLGLLAGAGYFLFDLFRDSTVTPETFRAVELGEQRADVLADMPEAVVFTEDEAYGSDIAEANPEPEGASCDYFMSRDLSNTEGTDYYRLCFLDGKLVEKTTVTGE